ncbi:hypothetical protein NEMBOFW57_009968 [Staphylotrichum longicolle]|uniref:Uncharacterized protein n=1 Tax=Staphylotrichum longicolle TaxID=669026 RepID=A0AAD4HVW6_9PEZI|nr:hypothetical protein NEMBOFW57_009968 [Staphylotrichum longicolle]
MSTPQPPPFQTALLAGALAGTTVDLSLFPLDTLKTRLHALVGSAPGAAFFFCTYESTKAFLSASPSFQSGGKRSQAVEHMLAASAGRWRPVQGWGITVMREVPFTILQFPLWEALKAWGRERRVRTGRGLLGDVATHPHPGAGDGVVGEVSAAESALYGSISGGVAAAVTTPLDVLKTRVMLSTNRESMGRIVRTILKENGVRPFFAGIGPRVMWISAGGAIFLGSYQWAVNSLEQKRLLM